MQGAENTLAKKRLLGFDFYRFFGNLSILACHAWLMFSFGKSGMNPMNPFSQLLSVDFWQVIVLSGVPIFALIGGFLALSKPLSSNEPKATLKQAWKYLRLYLVWSIFYIIINLIICKGTMTGDNSFCGIVTNSLNQLFDPQHEANFSLYWTGTHTVNWVSFWYIFCLIGVTLISPLLRAVVHSGNIKLIRYIGIVLFISTIGWNTFRMLVEGYGAAGTFLYDVFHDVYPFAMHRVSYFMVVYFYIGGWFAVDTQLREWAKKVSWWKYILALLAGLIVISWWYPRLSGVCAANGISYIGVSASMGYGYDHAFGGLVTFAGFLMFYKMNFTIKEESRFGKCIAKYGNDFMGVYYLMELTMVLPFWIFGNEIMTTVFSVFDDIGGAPLELLAFSLYCILLWFISVFAYHWLKKIPVVKKFI